MGRQRTGSPEKGRGEQSKARFPLFTLLVLLLVLAVGYGFWRQGVDLNREWFPVRYVRIQGGIENLDTGKLREVLAPAVAAGYFSLDIGEVEGAARSCPWVESVQVSRVWPDTLVVTVKEHVPVARWGEKAMLDARGERFAPDRVEGFETLPELSGPPGTERHLLRTLAQMNELLAPQGFKVATLEVSKRRAWTLRLENGPEMYLGRREPVEAVEHFLSLVGKLGENRLARLLRVDLRYPNGFAVVWRPEADGLLEGGETPSAGLNRLEQATWVAQQTQ